MNYAPEWQDGECCFRCRTEFTIVARKHHCRNCGNVFCAKCSSQQIPIPKFGIEKNVRVCDDCFEKLAPNGICSNEASLVNGRPSLATTNSKINASDTLSTSSSATIGSTSTNANTKTPANASAPSEQELKEEEELQLALALSLSEAETPSKILSKISFPDCKQLEMEISNLSKQQSTTNNNVVPRASSDAPTLTNSAAIPNDSSFDLSASSSKIDSLATSSYGGMVIDAPLVDKSQSSSSDTIEQDDKALFKFVAELQSSAEVFVNRINSNKLRGRPIANDTAIQSLFLNLTNMHSRLLEYIKEHDDQRAYYEGLQDKITQIHDARAALDALREEHQEKIRLAAEEAERNRQNQLAHKLELMRQKKSQMLQYQRDMAMQRVQEQELEFLMRQDKNKYTSMNWHPQTVTDVNNPAPNQGQIQVTTSGAMLGSVQGPMQGVQYDQSSWQPMASNISGIRPNVSMVSTINSIANGQVISSMASSQQPMVISAQPMPHQALPSTTISSVGLIQQPLINQTSQQMLHQTLPDAIGMNSHIQHLNQAMEHQQIVDQQQVTNAPIPPPVVDEAPLISFDD